MEKISTSDYVVTGNISLKDRATLNTLGASEKDLKKALEKERRKLAEFQDRMYAHGKYGVLICIQGMDTAGKDSLIREVFKDLNARGVVVHSFKTPSAAELRHDYLWRHYIALPDRGKFSVFNRTHYENVLVTRVHPEYILHENIPGIHTADDIGKDFWDRRFEQINNFERHIVENGTIVFKFFLHLSKEEQRKRLLRRLNKKNKNWKFSAGDLDERKLWDVYQKYYEEAINHTSTDTAPWYVLPADSKKACRLILAGILYDELKKYADVKEPEPDAETLANLETYKKQLEQEGHAGH
ncbi:PPK2 family polyphosphate kinase [Sinomicrobium soli]|uniref:PPK2 family polyphosphate kinase n=1 Tax=Sinomicrobium sp. N-1-3-6 TaxID=2219864 RepID=UPI000DCC894D|nr:PPK2 family polyphosphate kinase [Sinomicrobium sp. N-1-3-6]RAV28860.1 polyphosphate kinase 2 family protein [Sinomicrobium sp. N-1-3-6]